MSTLGYLQSLKYKGRQRESREAEDRSRTQSMEDKQMALMDAEIANLNSDSGTGNEAIRAQAQQQATDYLGRWNKALNSAEGMYSSAISEVGKAGELIDRAYGDMGDLDEVGADIKGEWDQFKTTFSGVQGDLMQGAGEAIQDRSQLRRQFMDLTRSDEEGAAGRAMADVSGMAERGRQAETMKLQGMGIDPTSGRSRSLMRESRNQEALSGTLAANTARRGEKDRVAGLTAQGLQLIDPSPDISAASQIQQLSGNLLAQRSNMATTKASLKTNLAGARGNLASTTGNIAGGQARNIAAPIGEYGATQQGIAYGATGSGASTPGGSPNTVSSYAASVGASGFETSDKELTSNLAAHVRGAKKGQDLRKKYYG